MATQRLDSSGLKTVFPVNDRSVNRKPARSVSTRIPALISQTFTTDYNYRDAPIPVLLCVPAATSIDR
jgi:hypothetical protein